MTDADNDKERDHKIKELETLMRHKPDADIHEMPGS